VPAGSVVKLSWSPERLPFHGLEFSGRGEVWAGARIVKRSLASLVDAVVNRLDTNGITDSPLHQDWTAIQSADVDETTFCECAGALGLDPYSLDDNQQREIEETGHRLPTEIVSEFFRAARTRELSADADEIDAAIVRARCNTGDLILLKDLRQVLATELEPPSTAPWEEGYSLARKLRAHLGLNGAPLNSIERIGTAVGIAHPGAALSGLSEHIC